MRYDVIARQIYCNIEWFADVFFVTLHLSVIYSHSVVRIRRDRSVVDLQAMWFVSIANQRSRSCSRKRLHSWTYWKRNSLASGRNVNAVRAACTKIFFALGQLLYSLSWHHQVVCNVCSRPVSLFNNIHCVSKKGYHPTTNDNFDNCLIPVIFGTNITE